MTGGRFVLILILVVKVVFCTGQCPDKHELWNRIIYLKDSSKADDTEKLNELLHNEKKIQDCNDTFDSTYAYLLQRIGWMYATQKDYLSAVKYTNQAISVIKANRSSHKVSLPRIINCYYNLQIIYDSLKLLKQRNQSIDSCIAYAIQLNNVDLKVIYAIEYLVQFYFENGDYQNCLKYSSLGESLQSKNLTGDIFKWILIWKVNALIELKEFKTADSILLQQTKNKSNDLNSGVFLGLYAKTQKEEGKYEKALLIYKQSFFTNKKKGLKINCSTALNNIGFLYFDKLHQFDKALFYYLKSLPFADAAASVSTYDNIANIYIVRKQYDSAQYFFQKAFDQIKIGISENDLLKKPDQLIGDNITEYLSNLLLDKGDAWLNEYISTKNKAAIAKAIAVYKTTDAIFDYIRSRQSETGSKLFWRQHWHHLYERGIEASLLLNNNGDAFYFFEKSRAVLLGDELKEKQNLTNEDAAQLFRLQKQLLSQKENLKNFNQLHAKYSEEQKEIFTTEQAINKIHEELKTNNLLYYQSFFDTTLITLEKTSQVLLKDHQAFIELFEGDSNVYVLIVTPQRRYFDKINKPRFDSLSSAYAFYISQPDYLNRYFSSFVNISYRLYQLLFQNIQLPAGRIIISPDGKYFPVEALITNTRPIKYFLEDHAVSYTYSARYLLNGFSTNADANDFIGLAPVHYTNGLTSLSGSDQSLKKIQDYFSNSTSFIGINASKSNFLNEFYKYKVIQLYTHATDSGSTKEPMIFFSDSSLSLSDLLPEKRPATNLIVLSACQTASGKLYTGEGVFSFNRSFAAIGIPSSVSNLWQVDDQATYKITELFYKNISVGMPLDIALQKAKKEFLTANSFNENKLPYYWAAPVLVGRTDAIHFREKPHIQWILVSAAILILLITGCLLIFRDHKRQQSVQSTNP